MYLNWALVNQLEYIIVFNVRPLFCEMWNYFLYKIYLSQSIGVISTTTL